MIVSGWLTISTCGNPIEGTWSLQGMNDPTGIGPEIGQGMLLGNMEGDGLSFDLNPGYCDNNVFLSGRLADEVFTGGWSYSTFIGAVTNGSFIAEKKVFHIFSPLGAPDRFAFFIELDEGMRCAIESRKPPQPWRSEPSRLDSRS